jgi:hypothetical protein
MSFSPSMKLRRRRYILTLVFVVPTISYSKARFDFFIALALAKNLWARTITTARFRVRFEQFAVREWAITE